MARYAVLIGNQVFDPRASLQPLRGPRNDVDRMALALGDPKIGDFQVSSIIDGACGEILAEVDRILSSATSADLVLVYYSGHGRLDFKRNLFLACRDTNGNFISSSIPSWTLRTLIDNSRAKAVILLLDCCYSGVATTGKRGGLQEEVALASQALEGRGTFILTSSSSSQTSDEKEDDETGEVMGQFTHAICRGLLTGEADLDRDGIIDLNDLSAYVTGDAVGQTPHYSAFNAAGKVRIAFSSVSKEELIRERTAKLSGWYRNGLLPDEVFSACKDALERFASDARNSAAMQEVLKLLDDADLTAARFIRSYRKIAAKGASRWRIVALIAALAISTLSIAVIFTGMLPGSFVQLLSSMIHKDRTSDALRPAPVAKKELVDRRPKAVSPDNPAKNVPVTPGNSSEVVPIAKLNEPSAVASDIKTRSDWIASYLQPAPTSHARISGDTWGVVVSSANSDEEARTKLGSLCRRFPNVDFVEWSTSGGYLIEIAYNMSSGAERPLLEFARNEGISSDPFRRKYGRIAHTWLSTDCVGLTSQTAP